MVYILTALKIEASPIINFYKLKKRDFYFCNDKITLIVTGVGEENILKATNIIKRYFNISLNDTIINIGIVGSKNLNFKIGELFFINKIISKDKILKIENKNILKESSISSFSYPIDNKSSEKIESDLVDMESYFIYQNFQKRVKNIYFLKIVSDFLNPSKIDKNFIYSLINRKMKEIDKTIFHSLSLMAI